MKYATFWQRFGAGWIDFFAMLPAMLLLGWLSTQSHTLALIVALPLGLLYWAYSYFFHAISGQTLGKKSMGIRVVNLDGSRISRSTSFRRSIVDLVFAGLGVAGSFIGLAAIGASDYDALSWIEQTARTQAALPSWFRWTDWAAQIWMWSEVVTVLFNPRRRAIHDYLAGTCVVNEVRWPKAICEGMTTTVEKQ